MRPAIRPLHLLPLLALALLLLSAVTASAHKVMLFASVEGGVVTGYAYAPGGTRLPDNTIEVFGPQNKKLGTIKTDAQGTFTFTPHRRCDLRFEMQTGDGHRAVYTVHAAELPPSLADSAPTAPQTAATAPPAAPTPIALPCPSRAAGTPCPTTSPCRTGTPCGGNCGGKCGTACNTAQAGELGTLVDRAVSRHVTPLREQLETYEQKIRWHDVLGGIGYIIGLAGLAAYGLARKRSEGGR